ncbi:MAG: carboxypeptidase M32 [Firmicutes bacterium]|nr:carboxypeptidase M32 [Bacillota bacterium]
MVRYELEREIMSGDVDVNKLPHNSVFCHLKVKQIAYYLLEAIH